jgi:hypothetical protein
MSEARLMATKLTLRLDESVIRDAKRAARARGVSLSEMVSGYFRAVSRGKSVKITATPVLAEISGVLGPNAEPKKLIEVYHKHIEGKYR